MQPSGNGAKEQSVPLKRLVQKTWYVYQVTPMYQFQQDADSLKRYSRHLSSYLQSVSTSLLRQTESAVFLTFSDLKLDS